MATVSIEPLAQTEDGDIVWIRRKDCTPSEARRWVADECGDGYVGDWRVSQCHLRQVVAGDCPAHPDGERDRDGRPDDEDDCRCYEIEEGWWEECSHRHPAAVPAWRVSA